MRRTHLAQTAIVCAIILVSGCTGSSGVRAPERAATWQEIHAAVTRHRGQIRSLEGSGRISIETSEMAQSGSFTVVLARPDSVLLRIEGPFGIKVGAALLTRDSLRFYSALENRLFLGPATPHNLQRVLRFEVTFDDLLDLLCGGAFLPIDRRAPDSLSIDEDQFVLTYQTGGQQRRYWVDGTSLLLRRLVVQVPGDRPILDQSFSEYRTADGLETPFLLRTIRPSERQMLSLRYRDLTINPPRVAFSFSVPTNAQQIRWKD